MDSIPEIDNSLFDLLSQIQEQSAELTRVFIRFCQSVCYTKNSCNVKAQIEPSFGRAQWNEVKDSLGWTSTTATPYVKVGEMLALWDIPDENLV